jgi:hypothetical protein
MQCMKEQNRSHVWPRAYLAVMPPSQDDDVEEADQGSAELFRRRVRITGRTGSDTSVGRQAAGIPISRQHKPPCPEILRYPSDTLRVAGQMGK